MSDVSEVKAVVKAVDGADVLLEVTQEGCGRCDQPGGCGGQKLTSMLGSGPTLYRVSNRTGAQVGDCVRLGIPAPVVRRSATLAYVYPLLALILGAALGMEIGGDPGAMLGGLFGIAGAWYWVRRHFLSRGGNSASAPYLIPSD